MFGIIRHYGNNVNPFHQKSTTSIICIFVWFCSTNLSFIDIMQPMFWTVISASTSIHFCLLIASLDAESHRKWPRTFFLYFSDLPFYVVHSSVSTNSFQISNNKTIHGKWCTHKVSRWKWPGQWVWHLLVYELKYTEMNHIMNPGGGGVHPYKGLMGTCGQPGYVFRDFCLKQGIDFINFCLKQGIFS